MENSLRDYLSSLLAQKNKDEDQMGLGKTISGAFSPNLSDEEKLTIQKNNAEMNIRDRNAVANDMVNSLEPNFIGPKNNLVSNPIIEKGNESELFLHDLENQDERKKRFEELKKTFKK